LFDIAVVKKKNYIIYIPDSTLMRLCKSYMSRKFSRKKLFI
jgi:hypothetical protein